MQKHSTLQASTRTALFSSLTRQSDRVRQRKRSLLSCRVLTVLFFFFLAIDLLSDWDERGKWDKTFDGVSFLDQMGDFKVLKW